MSIPTVDDFLKMVYEKHIVEKNWDKIINDSEKFFENEFYNVAFFFYFILLEMKITLLYDKYFEHTNRKSLRGKVRALNKRKIVKLNWHEFREWNSIRNKISHSYHQMTREECIQGRSYIDNKIHLINLFLSFRAQLPAVTGPPPQKRNRLRLLV